MEKEISHNFNNSLHTMNKSKSVKNNRGFVLFYIMFLSILFVWGFFVYKNFNLPEQSERVYVAAGVIPKPEVNTLDNNNDNELAPSRDTAFPDLDKPKIESSSPQIKNFSTINNSNQSLNNLPISYPLVNSEDNNIEANKMLEFENKKLQELNNKLLEENETLRNKILNQSDNFSHPQMHKGKIVLDAEIPRKIEEKTWSLIPNN